METKKEEDKSQSDTDDSSSNEVSHKQSQPKHQNLAVKQNSQNPSVSPSSHKVQFAVDEDRIHEIVSGATGHEFSEERQKV